jgi:hypothetical protein
MIQEAAQARLTLRLRRVIKARRNDVADSLVRAAGVVMFLDGV